MVKGTEAMIRSEMLKIYRQATGWNIFILSVPLAINFKAPWFKWNDNEPLWNVCNDAKLLENELSQCH